MLTVGSLFSGIGGLDLGFQRAGFDIRFQVEIDEYCRRVLTKHWPDVPKYADIRDCGAHNLERVDVVMGGFPCQDISIAGKRAGLGGARSGLWIEMARIVSELSPQYVIVENVTALLFPIRDRATGRISGPAPIARVLGELAACGYDAEWECLSAAAFGAPHLRDRIFIVAYPCGKQAYLHHKQNQNGHEQTQALFEGHGFQRNLGSHANGGFQEERRQVFSQPPPQPSGDGWWSSESCVGRVAHGVSNREHRLRGLGNAVVPPVAEYVARCVMAHAMEEA